jgi:tetratricopeptide (TPR) repeat protein
MAQGNDDFDAALTYAKRLTERWPFERAGWSRLAETHRRRGEASQAKAALQKLIEVAPSDPAGYQALGHLAIQAADTAEAIVKWRDALARNPDDQALMSRVDWLAPEATGPWLADVPDDDAIESAIKSVPNLSVMNGTNVVYLLDDEVSLLNPDGSHSNVVTTVAYAVNQPGRDRLTKMRLRSGRHKILRAYAVGPKGV